MTDRVKSLVIMAITRADEIVDEIGTIHQEIMTWRENQNVIDQTKRGMNLERKLKELKEWLTAIHDAVEDEC